MHKKSFSYSYYIAEQINAVSEEQQKLLDAAFEATESSHAPYSHFHVGAAVALKNDVIIRGSNQENASFPEGLCAERIALYTAASQNPDVPPVRLAIVTGDVPTKLHFPAAPCGGCRQTILEYERRHDHSIEILLCAEKSGPVYIFDSIEPLLPFSFHEEFLK